MKLQYGWQGKSMKWFCTGMKGLVKIYGKDASKKATDGQSKWLFRLTFTATQ